MIPAVLRVALSLVVVALLCPLLPYVRGSGSAAAGFLALAGFTVRATLFAGAAMAMSSVSVVTNALRLRRVAL